MTEDQEVIELAYALGARPDPSGYILSADSSGRYANSIPLLPEIRGDRTYRRKLEDATSELYRMLGNDVGRGRVSLSNEASEKCLNFTSKTMRATVKALETLLHSFAYVASWPSNKRKYVGIPLNNNDFSSGIYAHLNRDAIRRAVHALKGFGEDEWDAWVEYCPHFFNKEIGEGIRTRMAPNIRMKDWLIQKGLIFACHPHGVKPQPKRETILLRVTRKDEIARNGGEEADSKNSYELERPLIGDEIVLPELNRRLANAQVSVKLPDYATYDRKWDHNGGKAKSVFGGRTDLERIFSEVDGRGGRLYGHWAQRLDSELRQYLTMRGQPTVEADYGSMHLVMLYAMAGKPVPKGDLYCPPGTEWDRNRIKDVLTCSVGTPNRTKTLIGMRGKLQDRGENRQGAAEELYDTFWGLHGSVCPHGDGITDPMWPTLQYIDSQIALRVLRRLLEQNITAIPIHDSFIVQERYGDVLIATMREVFREFFPGYEIRVKVESAERR